MRKLLIKLVAIETALLGWLSYWLFLVYANNPSVTDQLASSLQRFPQLSFSTIDIAVLVIIASLAVTLAFKFQRGLRPGIRLERALQMLENLMKRNLILESQVAELKIEKSHPGPIVTAPPPTSFPTTPEPKAGSWEKAFRTPLEAGPPASSRSSTTPGEDIPFGRQTGLAPPRIEPNPQPSAAIMPKSTIIIGEKGAERTQSSMGSGEKSGYSPSQTFSPSSWEDSPKYIGESKGILTPSPPPRKVPAISESGGLKQPYIPAPAPKTVPPSVVIGPMTSSQAPKILPPPNPPRILARPTPRTTSSRTAATTITRNATEAEKTDANPPVLLTPSTLSPGKPQSPEAPVTEVPAEKTKTRDAQPTKKRSPEEDN